MKTPLLVLAAIILTLSACELWENGGGPNAHDTYIEIPPGTQIPADKQKELVKILNKYNTTLYWVWDIDKKRNVGDLSCVYVHKTLLDQVSQSFASSGTTHSSIQIGARLTKSNCDSTHHTPVTHNTPWTYHSPYDHHTPSTHTTQVQEEDYRQARALVREVTPILEKYTRK